MHVWMRVIVDAGAVWVSPEHMDTTADHVSPGRSPRFFSCLLRGPPGAANYTWSPSWLSRCHLSAHVSLPSQAWLWPEITPYPSCLCSYVSLRPRPVHLSLNAEAECGGAICWSLYSSDVGRSPPHDLLQWCLSPHLLSYLNCDPQGHMGSGQY